MADTKNTITITRANSDETLLSSTESLLNNHGIQIASTTPDDNPPPPRGLTSTYTRWRKQAREILSTRGTGYILALFKLDLAALVADNLIILLARAFGKKGGVSWAAARVRGVLRRCPLVLGAAFMGQLVAMGWAMGLRDLRRRFPCFDVLIIMTSFAVDALLRERVREVALIAVGLRLWKVVEMVERVNVEVVDGARRRVEKRSKELGRIFTSLVTRLEHLVSFYGSLENGDRGQQ